MAHTEMTWALPLASFHTLQPVWIVTGDLALLHTLHSSDCCQQQIRKDQHKVGAEVCRPTAPLSAVFGFYTPINTTLTHFYYS